MAQDAQPWHMVDSLALDFMVRLGNAGRRFATLLKPADPVFFCRSLMASKIPQPGVFIQSNIGRADVAGAFDYHALSSSDIRLTANHFGIALGRLCC